MWSLKKSCLLPPLNKCRYAYNLLRLKFMSEVVQKQAQPNIPFSGIGSCHFGFGPTQVAPICTICVCCSPKLNIFRQWSNLSFDDPSSRYIKWWQVSQMNNCNRPINDLCSDGRSKSYFKISILHFRWIHNEINFLKPFLWDIRYWSIKKRTSIGWSQPSKQQSFVHDETIISRGPQ